MQAILLTDSQTEEWTKKGYILKSNPRAEKQGEVLFKSYVFVHTTERKRHEVFQVSGIVRYLFVSGKTATLSEKEIERIKIFCILADVKIDKKYEKRDEVEVITRQFIGLRGQPTCSASGQKLRISISALGCFCYHKH